MERFQKYCLSVLLVIICSNISAQIHNGCIENEDRQKLCEFYKKFLGFRDCNATDFSSDRKKEYFNTIHHSQNASDIIGKIFSERQSEKSYHNKAGHVDFKSEKDIQILKNFEKISKDNGFTETTYFKSKVSKIRNKDYLNLIS